MPRRRADNQMGKRRRITLAAATEAYDEEGVIELENDLKEQEIISKIMRIAMEYYTGMEQEKGNQEEDQWVCNGIIWTEEEMEIIQRWAEEEGELENIITREEEE
ncbi:5987_t:CDS:2 [Diversispora eburnea]|uniref:5987_t:CDS:1 n=1 Tax=Diversispora eburnea TaxID=1213867 RepID=A0A9N9BCE2_9GLOM|nr:5987_t:CDS:2 [Diversispora eburnea]